MAVYKPSGKANADVDEIYEYTIVNFGIERALQFLSESNLESRADTCRQSAGITEND